MIKRIFIVVALLIAGTAIAEAQNLKISQFDFARSIDQENRQPANVDTVFSKNVGTVYCFTKIKGIQDTTQIAHVWYYKDQEKARIELDVKSPEWRTWSSKKIVESWTGNWRVMVEDPEGNVIETKTFVIGDE